MVTNREIMEVLKRIEAKQDQILQMQMLGIKEQLERIETKVNTTEETVRLSPELEKKLAEIRGKIGESTDSLDQAVKDNQPQN